MLGLNFLNQKQLHVYFKRQTGKIAHEKNQTWLRMGNLKRKTESLLITAENNAIKTNYINANQYAMSVKNKPDIHQETSKRYSH